MTAQAQRCKERIYELTPAESYAVFDRAARKLLGISGEEFIAKWKNGGFGPDPDGVPGVMEIAYLMPSATV
jgi:hypothetical protein